MTIAAPAAAVPLNDIVAMPAHALSEAIRKRQVSCREVMAAYLAHIDRVNPKLNAAKLQIGQTLKIPVKK